MTEIDLNCYFQHFCNFRFANGQERCITPVQTTIEVAGIIMAHRTQVPLALAWAVSIHKSQVSSWTFWVNNLFLIISAQCCVLYRNQEFWLVFIWKSSPGLKWANDLIITPSNQRSSLYKWHNFTTNTLEISVWCLVGYNFYLMEGV